MKEVQLLQHPQTNEWYKAIGNSLGGALILELATESEVHIMQEKVKWRQWNRNIDEFRAGDIVWDGDQIVQISDPSIDSIVSRCKMVCPVERRVDKY
ncbi:hypothetical protein GRF59_14410 [Paenibacillus sp. HJL G12]|uniref:Uncharacterized protein n=1 Tax=Paenibacillus dendrobii TaxID=2691084 RepID=A0A7X3LI22_9BACL|nr:hypothetical protein [Paenibacillus dendrobii]MWV44810.1 hypothetical protein [Paenibacillus dendrobii]